MSWPEGWPYTDEQVNYSIVAFPPPRRVFAALATRILREYETRLREGDAHWIATNPGRFIGQYARNFMPPHFPPNRFVYHLAICEADDLPIPWNRRHLSNRRFMALSEQDKFAILEGAHRLWALLRYLRKSANGIAPLIGGMRRDPVSPLERFRQMQRLGDWFVEGHEDRVVALAFGMTGVALGVSVRNAYRASTGSNPAPQSFGPNLRNRGRQYPGPNASNQSAGGRSPNPAGTDPGSPETPRATRSRTASRELEEMLIRPAALPLRFPIRVPPGTTGSQLGVLFQQVWDEFRPIQSLNRIARNPTRAGIENVLHEFFQDSPRYGANQIHWETKPPGWVHNNTRTTTYNAGEINFADPDTLEGINFSAIRGNTLFIDEQLLDHPRIFFHEVKHTICADYVFGVREVGRFPRIEGTRGFVERMTPPDMLEAIVDGGLDFILRELMNPSSSRGNNVAGGGP